MGGQGSGRTSSPVSKRRVEAGLFLSIEALAEHGLLAGDTEALTTVLTWLGPGKIPMASANVTVETDDTPGVRVIQMQYNVQVYGDSYSIREPIELRAETIANGGHRWWFACPSCDGRRGTLYLPPGEKYFACRRCHGLVYDSQMRTRTG
jgi:hypothetical protein